MSNFWLEFALTQAIGLLEAFAASGKLNPAIADDVAKIIPLLVDLIGKLKK